MFVPSLWVCKHTCISNQLTNVWLLEHVCFVLVFVVSFRGQVIGSSSLFFFFGSYIEFFMGSVASLMFTIIILSVCVILYFFHLLIIQIQVARPACAHLDFSEKWPRRSWLHLEMYFLSWELQIEGANPKVPGLDPRANSFGFWLWAFNIRIIC